MNNKTIKSLAITKGFTFLDLLIAISIMSILIGVAIPNLNNFYSSIQSKSLANTLKHSLVSARAFAIDAGKTVTICGINNTNECNTQAFERLVVFIDENENFEVDEYEYIYQKRDIGFHGSLVLKASFGASYIQFNASGQARQSGSFYICHQGEPSASHRITVSRPGRAYIAREKSPEGFVMATNGQIGNCN